MKHCSFCNAELPEGTTVCPSCGKDNAQGKAGTLKPGATVLMVVATVAVVILAVGVLFGVRNGWTTNAVSDMEYTRDGDGLHIAMPENADTALPICFRIDLM